MSAEAFILERRGELELWRARCVDYLGVDVVITTRHGGVSHGPYGTLNLGDHVGDDLDAVTENRCRVAHAVGVAPENLVIARQVHGTGVVDVDVAPASSTGDILIVRGSERAAAILVADCIPLVLINPAAHVLAVVHAGWRGLSDGALGVALDQLDSPDNVVVVIGPSISSQVYQVGPEVAERFDNVPGAVAPDVEDRFTLDLRCVARHQLMCRGVKPSRIHSIDASTDRGTLFFSDRAERPCGRFAMVAKWSS